MLQGSNLRSLCLAAGDQDFLLRTCKISYFLLFHLDLWATSRLCISLIIQHEIFVFQLLSLLGTLWTAACQVFLPSLSPGVCSDSWPLNRWCCCLLLLLPSVFPSITVFSRESVLCIRWPKYWSFSFSSSPSNEYSGLISFRIAWFDLCVVQGTLNSLFQWVSSSHQVAKILELQLQQQSFQWIFRVDFL